MGSRAAKKAQSRQKWAESRGVVEGEEGMGESLDEFISASASIDSKFEVMMLLIIPPPVPMKILEYYKRVLVNVSKSLEEGYNLTPPSH